MSIFSEQDVKDIAAAIYGVLGEDLIKSAAYSAAEAERIAFGLDLIHRLHDGGQISAAAAGKQVDALFESGRLFLETNEAISRLKARIAVLKGLEAAAKVVNVALGFPIIPVGA